MICSISLLVLVLLVIKFTKDKTAQYLEAQPISIQSRKLIEDVEPQVEPVLTEPTNATLRASTYTPTTTPPPQCTQVSYQDHQLQLRPVSFRGTTFNFTVGSTEGYGGVRRPSAHVLTWILRERTQPLVVDVGAGRGWFTCLAAMLGANVVAIEPQPACIQILHNLGVSNGIRDRIMTCNNVALDERSGISIYHRTCQPAFSIPRRRTRDSGAVRSLILDEMLPPSFSNLYRNISLVKIDTGGGEVAVLRSLKEVLAHGRLQNVIVHITPGKWSDTEMSFRKGMRQLRGLYELGFQAFMLYNGDDARFPITSIVKHVEHLTRPVHRVEVEGLEQWARAALHGRDLVTMCIWFTLDRLDFVSK